jgi:hypothetical protein
MVNLTQNVKKAGEEGANAFGKIIPNIRGLVAAIATYQENGGMLLDLTDKIIDFQGTLGESTEELHTTWQWQWEQMQAEFSRFWIELSEAGLLDVFKDILATIKTDLMPVLKDLVGWFKDLSPTTKKAVVEFLAIAAAIGPLLIFFGQLTLSIGNLSRAFGWVVTSGVVKWLAGLAAMIVGPELGAAALVFGAITAGIYGIGKALDWYNGKDKTFRAPPVGNIIDLPKPVSSHGSAAPISLPDMKLAVSHGERAIVVNKTLLEQVAELSEETRQKIVIDRQNGLTIAQTAAHVKVSADVVGIFDRQVNKAAASQKKLNVELDHYNEAWSELTDLEANSVPTKMALNAADEAYIRHLLDIGANVGQIVNAKIAERGAVMAVVDAIQEEKKAASEAAQEFKKNFKEFSDGLESRIEQIEKGNEAIRKVNNDFSQLMTQTFGTALDSSIEDIRVWAEETKAAFDGAPEQIAEFSAAIDSLANLKMDNLYVDTDALKANSTQNLREIADKAWTTYMSMSQASGEFSQTTIDHFHQIAIEAEDAANGIGNSFAKGFQEILKNIPTTLISSLTGGGGVGGFGKALGSQVGALVGRKFGESLSKVGEASKILGPLFGALGSAAGPLLGMALDKVFKTEEKMVNKTRQAFIDTFNELGRNNGLQMLAQKAAEAGMTLDRLLAAKNTKDYEAALNQLNLALQTHQKIVEKTKELEAKRLEIAMKAIELTNTTIDYIKGEVDAYEDLNKQIEEAKKEGKSYTDLLKKQQGIIRYTAVDLEALGVQAVAAFGAAISQGKSFADAMIAAAPGLQTLVSAFHSLGITSDNTFLNMLMLQAELLKNNPSLIQAVSALGQSFTALNSIGMLNTDTFRQMEHTGMTMYARLQDEVAKVGGTTKDALLPMQKFLHDAEKAAKDLGIPLDANTQMLIDQSKELGIWKEEGKSATDLMVDAMNDLVKEVKDLVDALGRIHDVNFTVTGHYNPADIPGSGNREPEPNPGIEPIPQAGGGDWWITKPTLFVAGEAGPERATFTPASQLQKMDAGSGGGGVQVGTITIHQYVSENVDKEALSQNMKDLLREDATIYEAISVIAQRAQ